MSTTLLTGDCRKVLGTLADASVHCCVTSPPYWGLRDYGCSGQIGLESTPEEYVAALVDVFHRVWRVLKADGTLWLNLGDCYATGAGKVGNCPGGGEQGERWKGNRGIRPGSPKHTPGAMGPMTQPNRMPLPGLKPKDLVGIPWRVAFALQAAGWWLRMDNVWHKLNSMPESVTDRPTRTHEYVFMFAKSERYFYDADAVAEQQTDHERRLRLQEQQKGLKTRYTLVRDAEHGQVKPGAGGVARSVEARQALAVKGTRNRRSVWLIPNVPGDGQHFAQMPPDLARICILAGCPMGGTVLDPFGGSGTTCMVAEQEGRNSIAVELNPKYVELARRRTAQGGLFCSLDPAVGMEGVT